MLEYEFIYQLLEKFKIKLFYTFCSIIRELKKPRSWEKTLRTKRTQEKKGVPLPSIWFLVLRWQDRTGQKFLHLVLWLCTFWVQLEFELLDEKPWENYPTLVYKSEVRMTTLLILAFAKLLI